MEYVKHDQRIQIHKDKAIFCAFKKTLAKQLVTNSYANLHVLHLSGTVDEKLYICIS